MDSKQLKNSLDAISGVLDKAVEPEMRVAVNIVLNLVESIANENEQLHQTIQKLRDEINGLKGEQGKPKIRPQKKDGSSNDHSSDKERKSRQKKKSKKSRSKKRDTVKVDRRVELKIDPNTLPADAMYKGQKSIVIQDLAIRTDNIEFTREVYYSPSLKKTFIADLPAGYEGEYGPGIRTLAISLYHHSNMTEPALHDFFTTVGVVISKATISRMLTDNHEAFHQEKEEIVDAGLQSPYNHMDDTSARVNGKNHYVHILSAPFFTAFFTRPKKDRLTLLEILCRGELKFALNEDSFQLMKKLGLPAKRLQQLKELQPEGELSRSGIDALLAKLFPNPKKHSSNRRSILEASALIYYHNLAHSLKHLMCDDAPQFNLIAQHKSLCWVHEGRHYKKLQPYVNRNKVRLTDFSGKFWDFYQELLDYTEKPNVDVAAQLEKEFDILFSTQTGYDDLDKRIALARAKKEALLLPLAFPFLPLHNNDAEGGAQHQARLRDIHLQTRNEKGTKAKDTFATIVKTARKLKVNLLDYFYDRITKTFDMSSLADLILENLNPQPDTS